jgi:hypothetical protein
VLVKDEPLLSFEMENFHAIWDISSTAFTNKIISLYSDSTKPTEPQANQKLLFFFFFVL